MVMSNGTNLDGLLARRIFFLSKLTFFCAFSVHKFLFGATAHLEDYLITFY